MTLAPRAGLLCSTGVTQPGGHEGLDPFLRNALEHGSVPLPCAGNACRENIMQVCAGEDPTWDCLWYPRHQGSSATMHKHIGNTSLLVLLLTELPLLGGDHHRVTTRRSVLIPYFPIYIWPKDCCHHLFPVCIWDKREKKKKNPVWKEQKMKKKKSEVQQKRDCEDKQWAEKEIRFFKTWRWFNIVVLVNLNRDTEGK